MRKRSIHLHIRYKDTLKIIRIIFGVAAVFVASITYSGYSINVCGLGEIVKEIVVDSSPVIDTICRVSGEEGARSLACTYLLEYFTPLDKSLLYAQNKHSNNISVGEINAIVGENKYSLYERIIDENDEISGNIEVAHADNYIEENKSVTEKEVNKNDVIAAMSGRIATENDVLAGFEKDHSADYLLKNFYIIDSTTSVRKTMFRVDKMIKRDFTITKDNTVPQILIYHTHAASEGYVGSKSGNIEDGIVGVGNELARILTENYGYNVFHDKTPYDMIDGKIDRSAAYAKALPGLKEILKNNPSIKMIIDLHRDGVSSNDKALTMVNGKKTARAMFFNGLSRSSVGKIKYLENENLFGNLSFSLQMKLKAMKLYPDFTKPIYLKGYRYNLHLLPRSLLIELGNQNNTVEEAKNAAAPLADIIDAVLTGR